MKSVWFMDGDTGPTCFVTYTRAHCKGPTAKGNDPRCPSKGVSVNAFLDKEKPYDKLHPVDHKYSKLQGRCYSWIEDIHDRTYYVEPVSECTNTQSLEIQSA